MPFNRRDALKFAGGSAVGLLFTPVPWKLLDDSAIWTQNWSWTPRVPRGEITTKFTTCTLCPAGCGVEARCCAGVPFALAGVKEHPAGRGALCAAGMGAHYIAYQPARIRTVLHRGERSRLADALAAVRKTKGPVAILDERPGRAVSDVYREFAQAVHGLYLTPGPRENATLEKVRGLVDPAPEAFGIDLEQTKTLLSFGAPVLDGWGAPGRVWAARAGFRLIQAEPRESRTASLADQWLPIRPGSEAALALGIAHILLRDGLAHADAARAADFAAYRALIARFTPEVTARTTGIAADRLVEVARTFAAGVPAVAIGGGDPAGGPLGDEEELAIAGLNLLAGSVGRRGGLVGRRDAFERRGTPVSEVADGSLGALIVDAAPSGDVTPWDAVKRKLAPGAVVVALAAFAEGHAAHADFIVPAPVFPECSADAAAGFDAPRAMFSLSPPLLAAARSAVHTDEFMSRLAPVFGVPRPSTVAETLNRRVAAIHALKRGSVFSFATHETKPLTAIASPEELSKALAEGACWIDDEPVEAPPRQFRLLDNAEGSAERLVAAAAARTAPAGELPLVLLPHGWSGAFSGAQSPMMTKLYQESGLRPAANEAVVAPETARAHGLENGATAVLATSCGECRARIRIAKTAPPGAVEAVIAPSGDQVLDLCKPEGNTWRIAPARIRRA